MNLYYIVIYCINLKKYVDLFFTVVINRMDHKYKSSIFGEY